MNSVSHTTLALFIPPTVVRPKTTVDWVEYLHKSRLARLRDSQRFWDSDVEWVGA
jgi:hypothetical protein